MIKEWASIVKSRRNSERYHIICTSDIALSSQNWQCQLELLDSSFPSESDLHTRLIGMAETFKCVYWSRSVTVIRAIFKYVCVDYAWVCVRMYRHADM